MGADSKPGVTVRHLVIFLSGLFLLSDVLIAPGLGLVPCMIVLAGCAGAIAIVVRGTRPTIDSGIAARIDPGTFVLCLLAGTALCMLGGEGHFFFANYDWLMRDAVLTDLTRQDFPVLYSYQGKEFFLRAPLGMYLVPAALGHVFGLHAAHFARLAQNAAILGTMLTLLVAMVPRRRFLFALIFVAFGGIEILARPDLIEAVATALTSGQSPLPYLHQHLGWWNPYFQYSNHVTQIFWVPNHAFPGWWLAILCLLNLRRAVDASVLIVSAAFLALWSPLSVGGALPVIAFLVLRHGLWQALAPRFMVAGVVGICFVPIAMYLGIDAGTVPHGWLVVLPGFFILYLLFIVVEIPHAAIVVLYWGRLDRDAKTLALVAIILLLLIPVYAVGVNNDLGMRASITPLALLAFVFGRIATELDWKADLKLVVPAAAIVLLAAVGPSLEIGRALELDAFAISDCNLVTSWHKLEPDRWIANYLARLEAAPAWLIRHDVVRDDDKIVERQCWPGHPWNKIPTDTWQVPENW